MSLDPRNSENKTIYLLCFLIVILVLSAYSNSLYAPFTLDDSHSFVTEPKVLDFTFSWESVNELTKTKFSFYRFLPILTFALDLQWGSGSVIAFHITNIVIHLLTSAALFFLLISLFNFISENSLFLPEKWQVSTSLITVFTVGLWALNPVQTNAVTYLVQRMTSMATFFCFLALGCYLRGRMLQLQEIHSNRIIFWFSFSLFLAICGFLCKEITVVLPALVLLIEFLFVDQGSLKHFLKKYRFLFILITLFFLPVVIYKLNGSLNSYQIRHFTLFERLLTESRIVTSYIFLLLLPLPQFLNFEYDPIISTGLFTPITTMTSLLFLAIVIVAAWQVRKKYPLITFCIYWFFINLLLESTIIPLELRFDHRLYFPSAGFYLLFVLCFYKIVSFFLPNIHSIYDFRTLFIAFMVILLSCLSLCTYKRNMIWQDSVTLHRDCVLKSPLKPRAHGNLAKALGVRGKHKEAIVECEKALSLGVKGYEEYWVTSCNLIVNISKMGNNQLAIERGEKLLAEAPPDAKKNAYPTFLHDLGGIYLKEANYQQAFRIFMLGLKFASDNKSKDSWRPYLNKFSKDILLTLTECNKENYPLNLGIKTLTDNETQLSIYEKMAEICYSINEMELATWYCERIKDKSNNQSTENNPIKNKVDKINTLNSTQLQKGTIKTKYFQHPFVNKFHFYMAITYSLAKAGLPNNFLINYFLKMAETLQPNNVDVTLMKSWLFYRESFFEKAISEVDKAISLDDKYAQLWFNRGLYCIGAGKNKEALEDFANGIKLYPGYPKKNKLKLMVKVATFRLSKNQGDAHE